MTSNIYNETINNDNSGILWSFQNVVNNTATPNLNELKFLPPEIIGDAVSISGNNEIIHDGVTVKKSDSLEVGAPNCLDQFIDPVFAASQNAFLTLGAHNFKKAELCFIAQRTKVEPSSASRPVFSDWHDHLKDRSPSLLVYQFSDALQTEFQTVDGEALSGHNNGIIRMGGGAIHRSATNTTGETITRTWAALLVYQHASRPSNAPFNIAFSNSANKQSLSVMRARPNVVTPFDQPIPILPQ